MTNKLMARQVNISGRISGDAELSDTILHITRDLIRGNHHAAALAGGRRGTATAWSSVQTRSLTVFAGSAALATRAREWALRWCAERGLDATGVI